MGLGIEVARLGEGAELGVVAEMAASALEAGQLVLHPTETVYGLGGDGSEPSNRLIARIKGRDPERPLLLLTPDIQTLRRAFAGVSWPPEAEELAARFWPGPLTLVVPCDGAPAGLFGSGGGLAVRVSPDPVVAAILGRWRKPMTSTSANLSGEPPARSAREGMRLVEERVDLEGVDGRVLVVDAGFRHGGRPSTIVDLTGDCPQLVRDGPVSREALRECLDVFE